jgi:polyvinyl alcohol dehydrogenase (cytochrome)
MRFRFLALAALLGSVVATAAQAPAPSAPAPLGQPAAPTAVSGAAVFDRACASCHTGQTVAPTREALGAFTPESIVNSLTLGKMAAEGAKLSVAEHRAVAEFLTGRAPTARTAAANRCTAATPTADPTAGPSWIGWGNDLANTRFAPKGALTVADLPRLKLKWAFGYEGVSAARAQPALAGGKLFAASENAEVHALDPKTGCSYWTFKADAGVRSPLTIGPYKAAGRSGHAVFFGDGQANAYAVDAVSGQLIWKRKVDTHASAGITGGLMVWDNKVFVPTQGLNEEGQGGRGGYACCTFRGSLSALDASTGDPIWKTYMVGEPQLRGKNRTGQEAYGPAGGGIWSAPTIDVKRRSVYVATGNGYADPPQPMTDAVVAMDIDTGKVKWVNQTTPNDNWAGGCGPTNPDNPGCPDTQGPDHDFSAAPALATAGGRQLLIVPQKSGLAYAMDPDTGKTVWQYRMGQGSGLGGQWGAAVDGQQAYFGVNDFLTQNPGGMRAVRLADGEQVWSQGPPERLCAAAPAAAPAAAAGAGVPNRGGAPGAAPQAGAPPAGPPGAAPRGGRPGGRGARGGGAPGGFGGPGGGGGRGCSAAQGGAVTAIPGAVLGVSLDGGVRAYSSEDGRIVWTFDTNREFDTVNGVRANGGGIDGSALIVADGMIYVNSGYGGIVGRPGNVLLAFGVE